MIYTYKLVNPHLEDNYHGILFYDDDNRKFGFYMPDNANAKHLPAIFKILVEKKGRLLDDKDVRMWIKDRIVPPERQNIGEILRNIGIENYDEFEILRFCKGRSCMDEFEIEECEMEEGLFIVAN